MSEPRKLTFKQKIFTTEYIRNGGNGKQAALKAYDTTPETAGTIAYENLNKPQVQESIERALEKNQITPELITSQIKDLAIKEVDKISGDVKLKAGIELLKLMGAYPGTKNTNLNLSIKGNLADLSYKDVVEELKVIDQDLTTILGDTNDNDKPISSEETP